MKLEVRNHEVRSSNELPGLPYHILFYSCLYNHQLIGIVFNTASFWGGGGGS